MKKLFTTLALAGAVVLGAHAQTEVDLGITNVFLPEDGASYENLAEGDTLYIAVEFKKFWYRGYYSIRYHISPSRRYFPRLCRR
ncbi:MAG: hypothetical protein KL787_05915 [Taibaiella sp.]|nr:hypothetical protein [Taibaiella sp.]